MKSRNGVYFYNFIQSNQHMIQNIKFLQLSMLKRNNAFWLNEIIDDIIFFNLVRSNISEIFILSFEEWKKTVYTHITLHAFTGNARITFINLMDSNHVRIKFEHICYLPKLILHQEICFQPNTQCVC